jgi:hypothetical protein
VSLPRNRKAPGKVRPVSLFSVTGLVVSTLLLFASQAALGGGKSDTDPNLPSVPGGAATPPTITLWYPDIQYFGARGVPQRCVNVLGNVSDPDGISLLTYSLNGAGPVRLSVGSDTRRLATRGDFNIDIPYVLLNPGANSLTITARDGFGFESTVNATIVDVAGSPWRRSYRVSWESPTSLQDSAQVVDGNWAVVPGGIRVIGLGYDRAIAIGDTTWDDYEITARMTVNRIDSTAQAFGPVSAGPALGFLMRWKGHTDQPAFDPPITQPLSGYLPYGALGWYHWQTGFGDTGPNRWELTGNNLELLSQNSLVPLVYGVPMYFKMRVKTLSGIGGQYSFKVWQEGESEPGGWLLNGQEQLADPQTGSVLILAHHVDVTVGEVFVEPLGTVTTPVLSAPADGATGVGLGLTLQWNPVQRAGRYHVQVSTDPSFGTDLLVDDPDVLDPQYVVNNLTGATLYYWRVRAYNPESTSEFSVPRSFTTSALAPDLLAPLSGSPGQPTSLTLLWAKVSSATSYGVQVARDSTFATGVVFDDQNVPDTSRTATGLPNGTTLYWRVRSKSGSATSGYSVIWNFVTILGAPVLVAPSNNATSQPNSLILRWRRVASASHYAVQMSSDSSFPAGNLLVDDSSVIDTIRVVGGLGYNTQYFWRVCALEDGGSGAFSAVWAFRTGLPVPVLLTPVQSSSGLPLSVQHIWSKIAVASLYHLQMGIDSTFVSGLVKNDSTIVDTTRTINGLSYLTTYYWRVAAWNVDGRSAFSPTFRFSTTGILPPAVVLVSPVSPATLPTDSGKFVWRKAGPTVTRYWFEIAADPAFQFRSVDSLVADTTTTRRQLARNLTYYWKVRAWNASGWGPYSETREFTVVITDVENSPSLPGEFAVRQNYPNPFNPSTRISLALPRATHVKMEVYSALGERLATLVDGDLPAGEHAVVFDGSRFSSGVYYYQVSTPEYSVVRKMLLVK